MRISDWSSDVCSSDLLVNKLRAYALQDQGFDTVDANVRLGFAIDARDFSVAARMLDLLNIGEVRLLTNNPLKVEGLEQAGIKVSERLPLAIKANPHNAHYLTTKRDRTGHKLRSEEHTSELQSLMRISYAVFCLKKKTNQQIHTLT